MKRKACSVVSLICSILIIVVSSINVFSVMALGYDITHISKEDVIEHDQKVISNIAGDLTIKLYEYRAHFYITIDDVINLTDLKTNILCILILKEYLILFHQLPLRTELEQYTLILWKVKFKMK